MFRHAGKSLRPCFRKIHCRTSSTCGVGGQFRAHPGLIASSTIIVASVLWYTHSQTVHNDALPATSFGAMKQLPIIIGGDTADSEDLHAIAWGSNRSRILSPDGPDEPTRTPSVAKWFDGVALRDLVLHQEHAACVDARGDVYQWGDGFFGSQAPEARKPKLTLRGKNIVQLQLTESRVFALSASGRVYALSTDSAKQELRAGASTASSDSWWSTGWLWGEDEEVDFVEITPNGDLAWGETFVSIAAGNDHLLGLTSKGRAYAHPVNKNANAYGQLGFRKFRIPDSGTDVSGLEVELIPKSIADPYARSSRARRASPAPTVSENLSNIDDSSIRFCPRLFEIPVLKGVDVAQVATGSRTSFVRTTTGRVLGWGANEYGQIGLGSDTILDTVTVPTEVVLWRMASPKTKTKCLDISAGGDLTSFTVERSDESSPTTIDLLMCGNGQWGGLGNNLFSNAQGNPVRARNVSGLLEYNDLTKSSQPIAPHAVVVSPTGHILLTLGTSTGGIGGRDLVAWGRNHESELGNGKRNSLPVPTTLATSEGHRFMLRSRKAKEVRDLKGKVWGRGVWVEQCAAVGFGSSTVYWKIS